VNTTSEAKESGMNAVAAASVEIHDVPRTREPVVVSAQGLTRRYGAGDTAVDAHEACGQAASFEPRGRVLAQERRGARDVRVDAGLRRHGDRSPR